MVAVAAAGPAVTTSFSPFSTGSLAGKNKETPQYLLTFVAVVAVVAAADV